MPAAPGRKTSEFWLAAGTQGAVLYVVVEPGMTWTAKLGAIAALTVHSAIYTVARTWIKQRTGFDISPDAQPATGQSADPLDVSSTGSATSTTRTAANTPSVYQGSQH